MDRRDSILKHIKKEDRGIEIGPWFNPLAPKREGFNCVALDVFDTETLKQKAAIDPNISSDAALLIESVDLIGSCTRIGELVEQRGESRSFDYVVSSHNFEHLPNPIRFLQGCATALKPGGLVSMAIPDHRACFDFLRPVTRLSDWIEAFFEDRERPTLAQIFDFHSFFVSYESNGRAVSSFSAGEPDTNLILQNHLYGLFQEWIERKRVGDTQYYDAHCSVFTPASFELLITDAAHLGLVPFEIVEITRAGGEFHAHLRSVESSSLARSANYNECRADLFRRIQAEEAEFSGVASQLKEIERRQPMMAEVKVQDLSMTLELEAARSDIRRLEDVTHAFETSTSWRITAPLRSMYNALRRRHEH